MQHQQQYIYIYIYTHTKKSNLRNTQVGQAVNSSSIRKAGEMVKNLYLLKIVQKFNLKKKV